MSKRRAPQQAPAAAPPGRGKRRKKGRKGDVYEADDSDPEEEKHADRYDAVENYEYEMPSDFEDEEIDEDMAFTAEDRERYAGWFGDEDGGGGGGGGGGAAAAAAAGGRRAGRGEFADLEESSGEEGDGDGGEGEEDWDDGEAFQGASDEEALLGGDEETEDDDEEEDGEEGDDEKYRDMLASALGAAPRGEGPAAPRRRAAPRVVAEAYPESEFHGGGAAADGAGGGGGELRLSDLMAGLGEGRAKLGASRKLLERLERRGGPVEAPLPRAVRERQERKAGYEATAKDVTKWQPVVKANREAPTLRFTSARHEVPDRGASTAALLEGFRPEGDMEAEVAALLEKAGAAGAAAMAEAERALGEQGLSPEERRERAARLAKMRNVLYYAEQKAKRLAKIKSKEFHRRANKAAKRAATRALANGGPAGADGDGSDGGEAAGARRAAREEAEFERARERLTLKHRNTSRWARRALKRGVDVMDAGTKAALAEQQALGVALRRRIEGRGSGSDGGSDGGSTSASEGEGGGGGGAAGRARREVLGILGDLGGSGPAGAAGDDAGEKGGLFSLPFMRRALEKQRAEAAAEAAALLRDLEGGGEGEEAEEGAAVGRLRFGGPSAGAASAAAARRGAAAAADGGGSGSDDEEDAEAKAERLGRRLRGEPEPAEANAAAAAAAAAAGGRKGQRDGGGGAALPARGLRRGAATVETTGPLDVDTADLGPATPDPRAAAAAAAAAAGKGAAAAGGRKARGGGGGGDAVLAAASAHNAAASGDDWLFGGKGGQQAQQGQQQQQQGQGHAFVAASTFGGARAGFVFKRGPRGVGYYREAPKQPSQAAAAAAAAKQQQARGGKAPAAAVAAAAEDGSDGEGATAAATAAAGRKQRQQQQRQAHAADGGAAAADAAAAAAAAGADADGGVGHHMAPLSGDADAQRALLARAFASDDVAADFEAEKAAEVEEQLPKEEAPGLMPGWGLWADQQREPKWMAEARAKAARKKEAAAASRRDAKLAHVVIAEKWDKKAAKYCAPALPFPFRSADAYEHGLRQPLGRDVNPDAAFRNLTRPAVIKAAGVVIDPLRYSKGAADYGAGAAAKARGVVTVAGGVPLRGEGPGAGAGGGAAGAAKKAKAKKGGGKAR
ncbi:hypothetical protein Rsub_03516 [Raphidocelis subcapitata]|uniref:U3 small nucleolar RNA-associated protein n=1 Tax=Raphidocelis subcapitata TaxID=307507 RepID=A0A2V0NY66_9CHLO|nr:hypothetical protein Rsub_03516 [Raphidocelis subcapitata]|eukprot:GBF90520.1 hypothetical protein Rsub_03516 [Raphidocelis subcapitata]